MGGKGGGRIGRRELQAHGEGGEAGEGCRSGTGSGAWAVCHLGEHVVVRAQQGVGPLFVVPSESTDYSYNLSNGQIIAILMHFGSSCRSGARLKLKMESATDLDSLADALVLVQYS